MFENKTEQQAKEEILKMVEEYCNTYHNQKKAFQEGDRIPYASRVYDSAEMVNLVDSSLEFWLTAGRYTAQFEKAFAEYLGIKPIIILNKIDLDKKKEFEKIKETYQNIGYTVIETIAKELENAEDISSKNITSSTGIQELEKNLKGNINAFSGNSGVGKSTLINAIFNDTITQEGEISQRNKKGKNTTTSTKLYEIDENTYIADTPGFSTFDISEIEYRKLDQYFKEFKPLLENCEFVGCTHIKEQNCGIKKALEKGKIDSGRYERFCKIYEELKEKERYKW